MSGHDDELSPKDLAALDEYENSEEGKAAGKPAGRAAQLTQLFYKFPEMQECRLTADAINHELDPGDTVPLKISVPRQFIRLVEFLEQKRASDAGVAPRPASDVLAQILTNDLHEQLHWLVTEPAHFAHYRKLWNRFCDEQGAAEEKISEPGARPALGGEGPF